MKDISVRQARGAAVTLACLLLLVAGCSQTAEQAHPTTQLDAAGTDQGMDGKQDATESKSADDSADGAGNADSVGSDAGNGEEQESEVPESDGPILRQINPDGSVNDVHLRSQSAGTADEAKTRQYLKLLALQYFGFVQQNGVGPGNWQALGRDSDEVDSLIELQRLGYDVVWGVPQLEFKPQSILAYPTDAAKNGGSVGLMGGTVQSMSAEEFRAKWMEERGTAAEQFASDEKGPGVGVVVVGTKLATGDKLLGRWGERWYDVVVLSVLPGDRVRIHYEGFSDSWDEDVDRSRLRLKTNPVVNLATQDGAAVPEVEYRMWTDETGNYRADAQFQKIDEERQLVFLKKREGRVVAIPINKLSDDDQEHIREAQAKR